MIIERTKEEGINRLPGNIDVSDLQDMTDWFQYKEIVRKSKATQKDVDKLVKKVKKGRYERTKAIIEK